MYLSKIKLSWGQAKNPYEQHRALWKLFPNRANEKRDFLYRVEQVIEREEVVVIMQSLREPQHSDDVELLALVEMPLDFYRGQNLRFRVKANPIKTIKDSNKGTVTKNGHTFTKTTRVPLIHEEEQRAWLERKFIDAARLETVFMQKEMPLSFRKVSERRNGIIKPVLFDGIMVVEDTSVFTELLVKGIGPAKSFGCGMLSLAPA